VLQVGFLLEVFVQSIYYEVSHFVILSSLLFPLHPRILQITLWLTSHVNFVVL
jgi:hypothetical protein